MGLICDNLSSLRTRENREKFCFFVCAEKKESLKMFFFRLRHEKDADFMIITPSSSGK